MTVIVGICEKGQVWLGADSYMGYGDYALERRWPKVFRLVVPQAEGSGVVMLVGESGDQRAGWLVRQLANLPKHEAGVDGLDYVAGPFVDKLREIYKEKGWALSENGREGGSAQLLIGYQGRLFSVWDEFQVVEGAEGYMAMGSGMYFALGALVVTEGIPPERRLDMVLEAVERHHVYVRRPFVIANCGDDMEA